MRRDIFYMLTKEYLSGQGGEQFKDWLAQVKGFESFADDLLKGMVTELSNKFHTDGALDGHSASLLLEYFTQDHVSLLGFLFRDKEYSPTESMRRMRSILETFQSFVSANPGKKPECPVAQAHILLLTPALS